MADTVLNSAPDVWIDHDRSEQGDLRTEGLLVNMGPQHPATHGVLRVVLRTDGEMVLEAIPHLGYLHRCAEKIGECLQPFQFIPYTDRMDYLSGMNNNQAFAYAVEKLCGVEVPDRAQAIRVIFAELNRIASHLVTVGCFGLDMGAFTPFTWCFREREMVLDLFEAACGARLTYSYITVGGVREDLPEGWADRCREFLDFLEPKIAETFVVGAEGIFSELEGGRLLTASDPYFLDMLASKEIVLRDISTNLINELQRNIVKILAEDDGTYTSLREAIYFTLADSEEYLGAALKGLGTRASRIARTESTTAANFGRQRQMLESGVLSNVWLAQPSAREHHAELNGEEVPVGDSFGYGLRYPGDPTAPVGEIVNCRCVLLPGATRTTE